MIPYFSLFFRTTRCRWSGSITWTSQPQRRLCFRQRGRYAARDRFTLYSATSSSDAARADSAGNKSPSPFSTSGNCPIRRWVSYFSHYYYYFFFCDVVLVWLMRWSRGRIDSYYMRGAWLKSSQHWWCGERTRKIGWIKDERTSCGGKKLTSNMYIYVRIHNFQVDRVITS